ncbi:MAG: PHP domain-containing protein [Thermodesulfovibrionales bacterium]|jgi:predicted metal-dependent phosphoesterase TrpH
MQSVDSLKFDLHIHSRKSHDSFSSISDIIKCAKKRQLDGIALTDHEISATEDGEDIALRNNMRLIKGNEVQTEIGDIIGLFISKPLRSKKAESLVEEIHDQGGIAILAHPFKYTRSYPVAILEKIDAVEVINARWKDLNMLAGNPKVSELLSIVKGRSAGSDSHFSFEVGRAYWVTPYIKSEEELKKSICNNIGYAHARCYSAWLDEVSQGAKFLKNPSIKQLARIMYWTLRHLTFAKRSGL